tara:strand:- start:683 stop:1042 length:360 start_codon:yes stop_codon:yes gene_type:complete
MVHTTVLHANHLGMTASQVAGIEYMVDATIDISTYTAQGEVVTATELGLSSIQAVLITGREVDAAHKVLNDVQVKIAAETGVYESSTSFKLVSTIASSGAVGDADGTTGAVRIRAYGRL